MKIYCDIIKENIIESIKGDSGDWHCPASPAYQVIEVSAVEIDTFALPEDIKFKANETYTLWINPDISLEFTVKHYFISEERVILEGDGVYKLVGICPPQSFSGWSNDI